MYKRYYELPEELKGISSVFSFTEIDLINYGSNNNYCNNHHYFSGGALLVFFNNPSYVAFYKEDAYYVYELEDLSEDSTYFYLKVVTLAEDDSGMSQLLSGNIREYKIKKENNEVCINDSANYEEALKLLDKMLENVDKSLLEDFSNKYDKLMKLRELNEKESKLL